MYVQLFIGFSLHGSPTQYKLVAMIAHIGPNLNHGHYVSWFLHSNGSCLRFNDGRAAEAVDLVEMLDPSMSPFGAQCTPCLVRTQTRTHTHALFV